MKINVNVKRKFRINGKEYGSLEEMPEDLRAIALKTMDSPGAPSGEAQSGSTKIVFNGVEYASLDEMPTYARNLYEQAVEAARTATQGALSEQRRPGPKTIEAEPSFSARSIAAVVALIALALLLYYLFSSR